MQWHRLVFPCPKCDRELTMLAIVFNACGQIGFNLLCVVCGVEWNATTDFAERVRLCALLDKESEEVEKQLTIPTGVTLH